MIHEVAGSKWLEGVYPDTPCFLAAKTAIKTRLGAVEKLAALAADQSIDNPEYAHQLRVSSRRADAALKLFAPYCEPSAFKKSRRAVQGLRQAAATIRNDDVHLSLLARESSKVPADAVGAVHTAIEYITCSRTAAQDELRTACLNFGGAKVRKLLLKKGFIPQASGLLSQQGVAPDLPTRPYTFGALNASVLAKLAETLAKDVQADLVDAASLHRLRITSKKLRYALELLACCLPQDVLRLAYRELVKMQSRLGRINDYHEISTRLHKFSRTTTKHKAGKAERDGVVHGDGFVGMTALADFFGSQFQRSTHRFLHWSDALRQRKVLDAVMSLAAPSNSHRPARHFSKRHKNPTEQKNPENSRHRRVAAIDVGTNSIRMAVAETDPAIGFRIIEDVKETTRLGTGVFRSGNLKIGAVKRSLIALNRMRSIAENYKVDSLRAIATSAVREAANGGEFVKLVRRRVGIPIEVVQPQREARLAFSGVCRHVDLVGHRIAVVDIGGGSTELIFAIEAVINTIRPLRLGAVRLTEAFEKRDEPGGYHYRDMRRYIDKVLQKAIPKSPFRPEYIIGAGGTFTSLARVALREGNNSGKSGRFPFAVGGFELRHKTVYRVLTELRRMSLEERCRVPGLSIKRAEIIVAGLCIVDRLMDHLRVDRLLIHDGGIRDGLVAEMIHELGFHCQHPRTHPEQVVGAVARYAERMSFPRAHSEHVASLALQIFDALGDLQPDAAGTWASRENRDLLRCAALLHDVGIRISHKAHHKHAYDMITHADLATLTRREIEIIANICRYHRKRGPRRRDSGFRKLRADDQRVVAYLAGILRIADGLDYSQKQNVTELSLKAAEDGILIDVSAIDDPHAELKRAAEKADVFESAFHTKFKCCVGKPARVPVTNLNGRR